MPKLAAPGVHALNNLTAELLDQSDLKPSDKLGIVPRIRVKDLFTSRVRRPTLRNGDTLRIDVDASGEPLILADTSSVMPLEVMRYLPEGEHVLKFQWTRSRNQTIHSAFDS